MSSRESKRKSIIRQRLSKERDRLYSLSLFYYMGFYYIIITQRNYIRKGVLYEERIHNDLSDA